MSKRPQRLKALGLLLTGVLVGGLLVTPVGAHFRENTGHLGGHAWLQVIKKKVYTKAQADNRFHTKGQLDKGVAPGCKGRFPGDVMVKVGPTCVDKFEASVWSSPTGGTQYGVTGDDYPCDDNGQDCRGKIFARSVPGVKPSAFITWFQAQAALSNVGKRLPTNAEWQAAAQGTPDPGHNSAPPGCRTAGGSAVNTGSRNDCVSDYGVFDAVGNVWEFVADWDEMAAGCENWSASFGGDITCLGRADGDTNNHSPGALIRGGNFDGGTLHGVFAVIGFFQPSFSIKGFGFRGAR